MKLTDDRTRITRKIPSRDKESPSHLGEDRGFASRMTRFSSPHAERRVYLQIVRTPILVSTAISISLVESVVSRKRQFLSRRFACGSRIRATFAF